MQNYITIYGVPITGEIVNIYENTVIVKTEKGGYHMVHKDSLDDSFKSKKGPDRLKSKAKQTFIGDYNYLVVTNELWEKIKEDTELGWKYYHQGILVFSELSHNIGITSVKKAKKQQVSIGTRATVLESMVRSLNREVGKLYKVAPYWEPKALKEVE